MSLQLNNKVSAASAEQAIVPNTVLENLAARFRPGGLFLVLLRPDGTVAYHDPSAGMFYHRYVLPLLQYGDSVPSDLREKVQKLTSTSTVSVVNSLSGVMLAVFTCVDRRQLTGALVLAGKSSTFKLGEDVVRVCSQLGLDGIWLNQQAEELPTYTDDTIQR